MLGSKDAMDCISQLSKETFLCSNDVIATMNFIIVKKTGNITTDSIIDAVNKIKQGGKK